MTVCVAVLDIVYSYWLNSNQSESYDSTCDYVIIYGEVLAYLVLILG